MNNFQIAIILTNIIMLKITYLILIIGKNFKLIGKLKRVKKLN